MPLWLRLWTYVRRRALVAEEPHQLFNARTAKRIDLVVSIAATELLLDVTTIDANNPSNGFLRESGLSPSYFPGAASVIAAKNKWDKIRFLIKGPQQQLVLVVLEVQDRWGHCDRQLFKRIFSKIPIAANRVSRNFWSQRITLAQARCVAANISKYKNLLRLNKRSKEQITGFGWYLFPPASHLFPPHRTPHSAAPI